MLQYILNEPKNCTKTGFSYYLKYSATISISLIFICPSIVNIIPNYSQKVATFLDLFISPDALHVSGGSYAHHQEHITVHTVHIP